MFTIISFFFPLTIFVVFSTLHLLVKFSLSNSNVLSIFFFYLFIFFRFLTL